jgi:hypothetical protein
MERIVTPEERVADIDARKRRVTGHGGQQAQHPVWVRNGQKYYPVWEVPLERLVLNVDNKRFLAERELVERKLGRALDPTNVPKDERSIIAILLDSSLDVDLEEEIAVGTPSKDFNALSEDWTARGQIDPLWIRPDGTVRNGNRRLAMLRRLRSAGTVVNWVNAIILTVDDVDESELFRMEQREQLAENFKKRYQDVNALLALRDAAELEGIDWDNPDSITEVAGRLKHFAGRDDAAYAAKQLYAIRALDSYLAYINASGQYSRAMRRVEVFREVGLCMSTYQNAPDQQFELLQAAFAFVQAGRKYREIRQLRNLFGSDPDLFGRMVAEIGQVEDASGWDPENPDSVIEYPELSDATAPDDDDSDDDDLDVTTGPSNYPKSEVSGIIDAALDHFTAAGLDIKRQLAQALSRLNAVDPSSLQALQGDERADAQRSVAQIADWSRAAENQLERPSL